MIMTVFPFLSDLYAAAPAAEQQIILVAGHLFEQTTHAFQLIGGLLLGLSFASFGWVLLARPDVSKGYGWASVVLGLFGIVTIFISVLSGGVGAGFAIGAIGSIGGIALLLLLGWKVYSLSRTA